MVTLGKLVLVIVISVISCILLFFAEESYLDYGCYKRSAFNCSNCKKKCKWKYILKNCKEKENLGR